MFVGRVSGSDDPVSCQVSIHFPIRDLTGLEHGVQQVEGS